MMSIQRFQIDMRKLPAKVEIELLRKCRGEEKQFIALKNDESARMRVFRKSIF